MSERECVQFRDNNPPFPPNSQVKCIADSWEVELSGEINDNSQCSAGIVYNCEFCVLSPAGWLIAMKAGWGTGYELHPAKDFHLAE